MYLFSRLFWHDIFLDPKNALDHLHKERNGFFHAVVSGVTYWRLVVVEYLFNHCLTRASALAYVLLLTLIPAIASASLIVANVIEVHPEQVQKLLSLFLPYAPATLTDYILSFFVNAQKLRGLGVVLLIVTSVGLFGSVEESFNAIWKVTRARSFFARLRTFTMAMVYSPILFYGSFELRKIIKGQIAADYTPLLVVVPPLLSVLAFASLIWFVPNTRVRFKSALVGGILAAALFELERYGFGTYVRMSIQTQTVYGAFGVLVIFLVSIYLVALILLFGGQCAYVFQNFRPLLRSLKRWDRRVGEYKSYISLRIMIDVIRSFARREPPVALEAICTKFELTDSQASGICASLEGAGFIHRVGTKHTFVPAGEFLDRPVREVLDTIEEEHRRVPTMPDDFARDYLEGIFGRLKQYIHPELDGLTFRELIEQLDSASVKGLSGRNRLSETVSLPEVGSVFR